jgi:hypothetical protein
LGVKRGLTNTQIHDIINTTKGKEIKKMNNILNAIIRFCAKRCHTITCSTFDVIIEKDRMGTLKRRLKN